MNEPTNAQLIACVASQFQGYINQTELIKQMNLSPLMKKEFDTILDLLRKRLPDEAPASDKG